MRCPMYDDLSFDEAGSAASLWSVLVHHMQIAPPGDNLAFSNILTSGGWDNDTEFVHSVLRSPKNILFRIEFLIIVI